jgi:hypothetical protein
MKDGEDKKIKYQITAWTGEIRSTSFSGVILFFLTRGMSFIFHKIHVINSSHGIINPMGYFVELNTLLRPPPGFDFHSIQIGKKYTVILEKERAFPLHLAMLVIDTEWNFYGYAVAHSVFIKDQKTHIEFEMLSLFDETVKNLYKQKFIEAGKKTGEVN